MSTLAAARFEATPRSRLKLAIQIAAAFSVMSAGAVVMLIVAIATGFQLRRCYSERIATPLGRVVLWIFGIRYVVLPGLATPAHPVIYISNHTSSIDMFVLIALGLPNTRFFLSGYLRKLIPLGVIGYLIGIFWTVPQQFPEARRRIFKRAARILERSAESVYLSPEGERITTGRIGHFNKGAFHLAIDLGVPIVPLFLHIPPAMDPGKGLAARAGVVTVHVGPAIDTGCWRLDQLERHRDEVRAFYERWHRELEHRAKSSSTGS
jgi:1-acyl-sn-glycerol-3-phosphate acyltransferase